MVVVGVLADIGVLTVVDLLVMNCSVTVLSGAFIDVVVGKDFVVEVFVGFWTVVTLSV